MLDGGEIERMEGTVTGVARSVPGGVWVPGGGIEFPCEYVMYGAKKDGKNVTEANSPRSIYKSQENGKEKTELPMSCCLLFSIILLC